MRNILFISLVLVGAACAESPVTQSGDASVGGGKADSILPISTGSYRNASNLEHEIALITVEANNAYRRLVVGDEIEQTGRFVLTTNEFDQPRIQFLDEVD